MKKQILLALMLCTGALFAKQTGTLTLPVYDCKGGSSENFAICICSNNQQGMCTNGNCGNCWTTPINYKPL